MATSQTHPPTLNIPLLQRLRAASGQFVPLADLGANRSRVWDDLEALERFGFQIERHPYLGAAYRGPTDRLCPDQIEHELPTRSIGQRIAVWNRVVSTNDLAARAASTLANHGLVVLAEEQSAGRGQRGRVWTAPARSSLLMSVLLFPPAHLLSMGAESPAGSAWLTALAAVATAELVTAWTGRDARIKWPNDVRVEGRKIAGILVERALAPGAPGEPGGSCGRPPRRRGVVVGIGLNVSIDPEVLPLEFRARTTTLAMLGNGTMLDRSELARELIIRIDQWYVHMISESHGRLSAAFSARSEHLGRLVRVRTPCESKIGRLMDLSLEQGLVLEPADSCAVTPIPLSSVLAVEPVP